MKKIFIILVFLCIYITGYAQVTIGSNEKPARAALLDLKTQEDNTGLGLATTDKGGLLFPRVLLVNNNTLEPMIKTTDPEWSAANIASTKQKYKGLTVYNIHSTHVGGAGLRTWDGSKWLELATVLPPDPPKTSQTLFLAGGTQPISLYNGVPAVLASTTTPFKFSEDRNADVGSDIVIHEEGTYAVALRIFLKWANVDTKALFLGVAGRWWYHAGVSGLKPGATVRELKDIYIGYPAIDEPLRFTKNAPDYSVLRDNGYGETIIFTGYFEKGEVLNIHIATMIQNTLIDGTVRYAPHLVVRTEMPGIVDTDGSSLIIWKL